MDLTPHLLALVAPVGIGETLAPAGRLVRASSELGLRLTFEDARGDRVHVELAPLEDGARRAAETERFGVSYRSGGAESVPEARGLAICRAVAEVVARNEAAVLARLAEARGVGAGPRIREVQVTQLLEPADGFETLSPYVGCLIGCRFCYAQSRLASTRALLGLADVPWGSYVDVRVNAPAVLARELAARPVRAIKLCPIVSDPYQAVERRYRLTRACLEVLRDTPRAPPVMLATRSTDVLEDAALLASIPRAFVAFSVPTIDDAVRAHFEPRGAPIAARLEALGSLRSAGVRTCAVVQPPLPGSVDALADALAEVVGAVSVDVLRGEEGAAADFDDPRYAHARDPGWQRSRADAIRAALAARGVEAFDGEVPPRLYGEPDA